MLFFGTQLAIWHILVLGSLLWNHQHVLFIEPTIICRIISMPLINITMLQWFNVYIYKNYLDAQDINSNWIWQDSELRNTAKDIPEWVIVSHYTLLHANHLRPAACEECMLRLFIAVTLSNCNLVACLIPKSSISTCLNMSRESNFKCGKMLRQKFQCTTFARKKRLK